MDEAEIVGFVTSVVLGLIPFVPALTKKLFERTKPGYYLSLVEQRDELVIARARQADAGSPGFVLDRLDAVLADVEGKIRLPEGREKRDFLATSPSIFHYLVAAEGFLFIGLFFGSETLARMVRGASWESGIYFFEGILKPPPMRVVLLVLLFSLALFITLRLGSRLLRRGHRTGRRTLALFLLFNAVFAAVVVVAATFFKALDDHTTAW